MIGGAAAADARGEPRRGSRPAARRRPGHEAHLRRRAGGAAAARADRTEDGPPTRSRPSRRARPPYRPPSRRARRRRPPRSRAAAPPVAAAGAQQCPGRRVEQWRVERRLHEHEGHRHDRAQRRAGRSSRSSTRNGRRPAAKRSPSTPKLNLAAQRHSQDQADHRKMDHTGSDGGQPWDRVKAAGYSYRMVGENVAWNYQTRRRSWRAG
ncbi:hypothetical protein V2I01_22535 [Micromonospora sp. BRA006-A]|nr:hypothetical protein [Micromonospora sp. BRA006-A]